MTNITDIDIQTLLVSINDRLGTITDDITDLKVGQARMEERFNTIDQRFETVDQKFETFDQKFETVSTQLTNLDNRLKAQDNKFWTLTLTMFAAILGALAKVTFWPSA